uniref:Cytochrome n=1 Tax=Lutzomyia longipalpis TaxID=7200 RepID=A0A1B0GIV6_LUTLO
MFWSVVLIICGLIYLWQKWNYSFWQRNGVPGPNPSFFVGNLGPVVKQKDHIGLMADTWYKKYADAPYIGYYKAFTPAIMVRDMDLVKNILIKDFTSFHSNDLFSNDDPNELLTVNPFVQTDEQKWKLSRTVMSPMFTTTKLSAKFTTENVASCAFSLNANCFEDGDCEFRRMGKKIFQPSFWMGIKFMLFFFFPYIAKFFSLSFLPKDVDKWARRLIRENVASRKNRTLNYDDMLQIMLSVQDKYNLTQDHIAGHALSFFVDGYETSSTVLSFALWQLARHPDVQKKVSDEIVTVLHKHANSLSFEALSEMNYLDLVIQETLRINAVGLTMHKKCTKPYMLPKLPGQKEPFVLQPGTPILIPVYSIHQKNNDWKALMEKDG